MNWVYDRVVRHKSVNYHVWRAIDGGNTIYSLTRTSALAPKHVASYGSIEEVFWKTGVQVEPSTENLPPYRPAPKPAVGIYRKRDGWAEVDYGHRTGEVPRELYERKGYLPSFNELPLDATSKEAIPTMGNSGWVQSPAVSRAQ